MVARDEEEPQVEKANYRSMGRGHGGLLRKRRQFVRDFSQPTQSTIPSTFETVLYQGNREQKAFGQGAPRFAPAQSCEGPGPGACSPDQVEGAAAPHAHSLGRRGTSAFATRAPRLPRPVVASAPPGPGSYESEAPLPQAHRPSANFLLPGPGNPAKYDARPTPGPGDYTDRVPCTHRSARTRRRLVLDTSGGERLLPAAQADLPGPGHYDLPSSPRSSSVPPKGWTIGGSSAKKQVDAAAGKDVHLHLPLPLPADADAALRPGTKLLARAQEILPGPGDYDPEIREGRQHVSIRGLSSFQAGYSHLPRSWRPPSPGPGEYVAGTAELSGIPAKASFASASARFHKEVHRAPGPAYYSPRTSAPIQSFHLNMNSGWV